MRQSFGSVHDGLRAVPDASRPDTTLLLCGDVMMAHGLDPMPPRQDEDGERHLQSVLDYVREAVSRHTPLPPPLSFEYPWGDALALLRREQPDLRLVNLPAPITAREASECRPPPGCLSVHRHGRLHPLQLPLLAALGIDGAVLANGHVLDWGQDGLLDTLVALRSAGIAGVGAGHDGAEAAAEGQWAIPGKARLRLLAFGHAASGLPPEWAAERERPGINLLEALDDASVAALASHLRATREEGDIVVVALHWGSAWGYEVTPEQRRFAHALIDEAGVDLVWGLASSHPRPIEVHGGRLILYGVGGFRAESARAECLQTYRPELAALYLPRLAADGRLRELRLWPLHVRLFRLKRACGSETQWLARTLSRECRGHGTHLTPQGDGSLRLCWELH